MPARLCATPVHDRCRASIFTCGLNLAKPDRKDADDTAGRWDSRSRTYDRAAITCFGNYSAAGYFNSFTGPNAQWGMAPTSGTHTSTNVPTGQVTSHPMQLFDVYQGSRFAGTYNALTGLMDWDLGGSMGGYGLVEFVGHGTWTSFGGSVGSVVGFGGTAGFAVPEAPTAEPIIQTALRSGTRTQLRSESRAWVERRNGAIVTMALLPFAAAVGVGGVQIAAQIPSGTSVAREIWRASELLTPDAITARMGNDAAISVLSARNQVEASRILEIVVRGRP